MVVDLFFHLKSCYHERAEKCAIHPKVVASANRVRQSDGRWSLCLLWAESSLKRTYFLGDSHVFPGPDDGWRVGNGVVDLDVWLSLRTHGQHRGPEDPLRRNVCLVPGCRRPMF